MIGFIIDAEGKTSGHRVLRSIGGGCDQEALRVAKTIPNEQHPSPRIMPIILKVH